MRQLHYFPGNASMAPHILLREIGEPFELVLVDREHDSHKSAAYLRLNPNGLIPVFVDGDLVLYESAAICLHLADSAPQAGLIPAPDGSGLYDQAPPGWDDAVYGTEAYETLKRLSPQSQVAPLPQ